MIPEEEGRENIRVALPSSETKTTKNFKFVA